MAERNPRTEIIILQSDLQLGMVANGYIQRNGRWEHSQELFQANREEFIPEKRAFFGPNNVKQPFFDGGTLSPQLVLRSLSQGTVTDTISKYRRLDPTLAKRVAFYLGGIARHSAQVPEFLDDTPRLVSRAASLMKNGEKRSGDALAASIAHYAISAEGVVDNDPWLMGTTYEMSEAIKADPVDPHDTSDLGISQVARLSAFWERINKQPVDEFPDLSEDMRLLDGFPTVGAEFHLPLQAAQEQSNLWKRLALLNMSQYQRGSSIQMSRNDRDVIEVRMNPSVYPVTIANWLHIMRIVPEIRSAFFTITLNRPEKDFSGENQNDAFLIEKLRTLGLLTYAITYDSVPRQKKTEEVNFGTHYLGQTVRNSDGNFLFSGQWNRNKDSNGQMGIYVGFGKNLPFLAYYMSMALANPGILSGEELKGLSSITSLDKAIRSPYKTQLVSGLDKAIESDRRLLRAVRAGMRIYQQLAA